MPKNAFTRLNTALPFLVISQYSYEQTLPFKDINKYKVHKGLYLSGGLTGSVQLSAAVA